MGESIPRRAVALLLPVTGRSANIGQIMARASTIAKAETDSSFELSIVDTTSTPEGAATAAALAVAGKSQLILGPIFREEVAAALEAAGSVPVVAFSNDAALLERGAFLLGNTPAQSVTAIFRYARGQGVRRVAVLAEPQDWGRQAGAAARLAAMETGLDLTAILYRDAVRDGPGFLAELRSASGGRLPDAVLLPDGGRALPSFAVLLGSAGIQLLGTVQWSDQRVAEIPALKGAWFAAPDPASFTAFAQAYAPEDGARGDIAAAPGLLAGLCYDAVKMAKTLSAQDALNREGLSRSAGFTGIDGNFRFRQDGSCVRDLSIFEADTTGSRVIARTPPA